MSDRTFHNSNPRAVSLDITENGMLTVCCLGDPIWETPPKTTEILWCVLEPDMRWYLHLREVRRSAPPLPTLHKYLRHYEKMSYQQVADYMKAKNLVNDDLYEDLDDLLWELTWSIKYSPSSLAYDYLWERDIPNKRQFGSKFLFEQGDGLAVMPRYVITDDVFCLRELQDELYGEGVALVIAD